MKQGPERDIAKSLPLAFIGFFVPTFADIL
jgi:hypothetical protein